MQQVNAGDLQATHEGVGADGVEVASGDAGEDIGEGVLDASAVLDERQGEGGLLGQDGDVAGLAAGRMMMIAEGFSA